MRERHGGVHFDRLISPSTDNLVCNEVYTVNLIGVTREVIPDFIRLQVPNLGTRG